MKEIWNTTLLAPSYEISNLGRVRRIHSTTQPKLIKPTLKNKYHVSVNIWNNGIRKNIYVHKLVCDAFLGQRPFASEINHKNLNPKDNRLSNLEYITHSQNIRHAIKNGSRFGFRKLTDNQVKIIWHQLHCRRFLYRSIGKNFNVSHGTISDIDNQKTWKSVTQNHNVYSRENTDIQCNPLDYKS